MKKPISRVCIGAGIVGAVSAVVFAVILSQPVNTPISPKAPEAKAAAKK